MTTFPYLEVTGTYGDIGRAVGKSFANQIKRAIAVRRQEFSCYPEHLEKSTAYFRLTEQVFPQYIEELVETAKAAGVSTAEYFLMSNPEVLTVTEMKTWSDDKIIERCTTVVGVGGDITVGHNEDNPLSTMPELYVLKATIGDTTMLGLHYCTEIGGGSAAMNSWGLVQCINTLHTKPAPGVPRAFVARAILECKTLDEAEKLIRSVKRASGYNHLLVQGDEICNLETSPRAVGVVRTTKQSFVHTNHFLLPGMIPDETFHTESSEWRYKKASSALKPNLSRLGVQKILARVCNNTLSTLIFSPKKLRLSLSVGGSGSSKFSKYGI